VCLYVYVLCCVLTGGQATSAKSDTVATVAAPTGSGTIVKVVRAVPTSATPSVCRFGLLSLYLVGVACTQ